MKGGTGRQEISATHSRRQYFAGAWLPRLRSGFTIIEVMIVLAITGILLVSALALVNGKQNNTEFSQSVRDMQTAIQQTINQTGSGYFIDPASFTCKFAAGTMFVRNIPGGSDGTCVFVGKVVQLGVPTSAGIDLDRVYSVVAPRDEAQGVVGDLTSQHAMIVQQLPEDQQLQYGLHVVSAVAKDGGATTRIGSFAVSSAESTTTPTDASPLINVVAIPYAYGGSTFSAPDPVGQIQAKLRSNSVLMNPSDGVEICYGSGTTKQSAKLSFGASGQRGAVSVQIFSSVDCS